MADQQAHPQPVASLASTYMGIEYTHTHDCIHTHNCCQGCSKMGTFFKEHTVVKNVN